MRFSFSSFLRRSSDDSPRRAVALRFSGLRGLRRGLVALRWPAVFAAGLFLGLGLALPAGGPGLEAQVVDLENLTPEQRRRMVPLLERYFLDELKAVRMDMQAMRAELIEKIVEKELSLADKSMNYAVNTITYFFFMVAGVASLLALVGWTSLRDVKQNVQVVAEKEMSRLTQEYELRLTALETELREKSETILENQKAIEHTQQIHSLWIQAGQEPDLESRVETLDRILEISPDDSEVVASKVEALLELGHWHWALSIANRLVDLAPEYGTAYYYRARAEAALEMREAALTDLARALQLSEVLKDDVPNRSELTPYLEDPAFAALLDGAGQS